MISTLLQQFLEVRRLHRFRQQEALRFIDLQPGHEVPHLLGLHAFGDDPQTIFETLNSRGMPLSQADLLRNFIFQRAKGLGQSDSTLNVDRLYEKHWLPLDRQFWSQPASRGRQTRTRLDWMLTDHLAMQVGDIVSIEGLCAGYRKWVQSEAPFASVVEELESISATAAVEQRLFSPRDGDPVGHFGRVADAFDVSTAMPLVIYLATESGMAARLGEAFAALESYILRRDICGLTTKNYNRFFVALITRLRACEGDKVDELIGYLSSRTTDLDRWPDDGEWRHNWLFRPQYASARQPRLRYIFEGIERAKHTPLNEDIVIRSALTIEHIMPQKWQANWQFAGMEGVDEGDYSPQLAGQVRTRNSAVNVLGNLTLLTQALNSTLSNGPFAEKMPAIRANAALALNRELHAYDQWDEAAIQDRASALFEVARKIWQPPARAEIPDAGATQATTWTLLPTPFPAEGTRCRFTYAAREYCGAIVDGGLVIDGVEGAYTSFSSASRAVTGTSRNGWNDWYLSFEGGPWILADEWRNMPTPAPDSQIPPMERQ